MLSFEEQDELNANDERLERIKRRHDLVKAVKSDDAEVPIHTWDKAIFQGEASEEMQESMRVQWMWCLQVYRRRLLWDILRFLATGYGGISKVSSNAVWQSTTDAPYKGWASVAPRWRIRAKAGVLQPSQHRGLCERSFGEPLTTIGSNTRPDLGFTIFNSLPGINPRHGMVCKCFSRLEGQP
jgi:hypothetical protein